MSTPHTNRNWRRRWSIDLVVGVARHDSGFAVRLTPLKSGAWECIPLEDAAGVKEPVTSDYAGRKTRLMREALDLYRVVYAKQHGGAARTLKGAG